MALPPVDPIGPRPLDATQQVLRTNRILMVLVAVLLVALAGLGGWVLGRGSAEHGSTAHPSASGLNQVAPRAVALLRGIRCTHGTPIVEAQCPDGEELRRYVNELLTQGLSDDDIKVAMLRRFGESGLAGREW